MTDRLTPPIAFLVSTFGGQAANDVLDALGSTLERLGSWRRITHPESSLAQIASEVEASGKRAIQLAIGPVQGCYLTPAVPTILLPLWDYPDIPQADIHNNGRMNWARVASRADLILAPSRTLADAFRVAGVETPITVFPIPPRQGWAELPTWGMGLPINLEVPHVSWGGEVEELDAAFDPGDAPCDLAPAISKRRGRLRKLKPYFSNATIQKLDGYKGRITPMLRRPDPVRIVAKIGRAGYRRLIRRWVSEEAHQTLRGLKNRLIGRRPTTETPAAPPVISPNPLTLSGLLYSAVIDYTDPTIDDQALVSALIHAFQDRPDVTVVLRLVAPPECESHDLARLVAACESPRLAYRCRFVVVTGRLSAREELELGRATTYHVDISRSRGLTMGLSDALAAGRPAIAPRHSAFTDSMDKEVGFPVRSDPEPTRWPIDPHGRHATTWNRVVWSDLRDRLIESAEVAGIDHHRHEHLSASARQRSAKVAGPDVVAERLQSAIDGVPARSAGAFAWS